MEEMNQLKSEVKINSVLKLVVNKKQLIHPIKKTLANLEFVCSNL